MKIQPISIVASPSHRTSKRNCALYCSSNVNFHGTVGKVQGGLKGAMIGGLVWALGTMTLPVLPLAVAIGAITVGAIDNKLEDMVNEEEDKKHRQ